MGKQLTPKKQEVAWDVPFKSLPGLREKEGEIQGTLVLDVDGTITVPGSKYAVDDEAIETLAEFVRGGGNLIFCTGATLGRIERTVLNPLYRRIDELDGPRKAKEMFKRVYVMPENGSALLINRGVSVEINELSFDWHKIHELHVPDKEKLRNVIEKELIPQYDGSQIGGDHPDDRVQKDYLLCWYELSNPRESAQCVEKAKEGHPEVDWSKIELKLARTTIDFVNADSGKTISVGWVLRELSGLAGPVMGFGDLGDEFAKVVPTVNINKEKPNEFRMSGMPSMELTGGWELLKRNKYVMTGEGMNAKVRDKKTDREIQVLRDENGEVIYARKTKKILSPTTPDKGRPIGIKPLTYEKDGRTIEVEDAGKGTAWIIRRLMDVGYFKHAA